MRHPIPDKHYFFEYLDLAAPGRLRYSKDLAYESYLLRPEQTDEALRAYLEGLIGAPPRLSVERQCCASAAARCAARG